MIYSLECNAKKSEECYEILQKFAKQLGRSERGKAARKRLTYLDIALPHRGNKNLVKLIKQLSLVASKDNFDLSQTSITGNMPSLMSGGKDFCAWSPKDRALHRMLNRGVMHAAQNGTVTMEFAGTAVIARAFIANNNTRAAHELVAGVRTKAEDQCEHLLLENIDAFSVWISLLEGDSIACNSWASTTAPSAFGTLIITERYRYLVLARIFLWRGMYLEATTLLTRLLVYLVEYNRTYFVIKARILLAYGLFRLDDEEWASEFALALDLAKEFDFMRVVADEGVISQQLIAHMPEEMNYSGAWFNAIKKLVYEQAGYYPEYLQPKAILEEPLTPTEKAVLLLLGKGLSNKRIAETMRVSANTVKFHVANVYKKLGVNNRAGAVAIAKELMLIK